MKILFCNIAWMEYYKGNINGDDEPHNGGSYVVENGEGGEEYNFFPTHLGETAGYPEDDYCLGFVETKSTNGKEANQLKLEKIDGCKDLKDENEVDGVLVVFCALYPSDKTETCIVGWYKNATVYRRYELMRFGSDESGWYEQPYNIIAKKEDCVLLPAGTRRRKTIWGAKRATKDKKSYGFGQSNVWFAQNSEDNPQLSEYLKRIEKQIIEYNGENWIDKYPEGRKG